MFSMLLICYLLSIWIGHTDAAVAIVINGCGDPLVGTVGNVYVDTSDGETAHLDCGTGWTYISGNHRRRCYNYLQGSLAGQILWTPLPLFCGVYPGIASARSVEYDDESRHIFAMNRMLNFEMVKSAGDSIRWILDFGNGVTSTEYSNYNGVASYYVPTETITFSLAAPSIGPISPVIHGTHIYSSPLTTSWNSLPVLYIQRIIEQITITPSCHLCQKNTAVDFSISFAFGSHIVFMIQFGDGSYDVLLPVDVAPCGCGVVHSTSHTYTKMGTYTVSVTAFNYISNLAYTLKKPITVVDTFTDISIDVPTPFGLRPPEPMDIIFNFPSAGINDLVHFSIDFGQGTVRSSSTSDLNLLIDHHEYFQYERSNIDGVLFTVDVSSTFGFVSFTKHVELAEPIENLTITTIGGQHVFQPLDMVLFNVSVSKGSHVYYIMTFGDGATQTLTHPELFASDYSVVFDHRYNIPGLYQPYIQAMNNVSDVTTWFYPYIIAQTPITFLYLYIEPLVVIPTGVGVFSIYPPYSLVLPTGVSCQFLLSTGDEWTTPADTLANGSTVYQSFNFNQSHIGDVTATVNCSNLISFILLSTNTIVMEKISGVELKPLEYYVSVHDNAVFAVTMTNGSHASVRINFGDGISEDVTFPFIRAFENTSLISHKYLVSGNYTIQSEIYNEISQQTITLLKKITVQNPVVGLYLLQPIPVNVDIGWIRFEVISSAPLNPTDVFMTWNFHGTDESPVFARDLYTTGKQTINSFFLPVYIGTHPVRVNCTNYVSYQILETNFTLQERIRTLDFTVDKKSMHTGDTATVNVTFTHGSHVSFELQFGDGYNEIISYEDMMVKVMSQNVAPSQQTTFDLNENVSVSINATVSDYGFHYSEWFGGISFLIVKHKYEVPGNFQIKVKVYNDISLIELPFTDTIAVQNPFNQDTVVSTQRYFATPPGHVTFEFVTIEPTAAPTGVTCRTLCDGCGSVGGVTVDFGGSKRSLVTFQFPLDLVGIVSVNLSCSNEISSRWMHQEVILQKMITGLEIHVNSSVVGVMDSLYLSTNIRAGSYIIYFIDFGDGHTTALTIDGTQEDAIVFEHSYMAAGNYEIKVNAYNNFSMESESIFISVRRFLHNINFIGDIFSPFPPGHGSVYLSGPFSLDTTLASWEMTNEDGDIIRVSPNLNGNDGFEFTCPTAGIYSLNVHLDNTIDEGEFRGAISCEEIVSSIRVNVQGNGFQVNNGIVHLTTNEQFTFEGVALQGTHVLYNWIINDQVMKNNSLQFAHTFLEVGSYHLKVVGHNNVSSDSISVSIFVYDRAEFLDLKLDLSGDLLTNSTLKFILRYTQIGTGTCFTFLPGVGVEIFQYGAGCVVNTTTNVEEFIGELHFTYSYKQQGLFTFTILGETPAATSEISIPIAVNDKPCNPPDMTLEGSGKNMDNPRIEMQSSNIRITSFTMVSCLTTSKVLFEWFLEALDDLGKVTHQIPIDLSDTSEITFSENFLQLGFYKVTLHASMYGTYGMKTIDRVYLLVRPTPLNVGIIGGDAFNVGWNKTFIINAHDLTFDPDVKDDSQKRSGIIFEWWCGFAVVAGDFTDAHSTKIMNNETLNTADTSGCFDTPLVDVLKPGLIELNTGHLLLDAEYRIGIYARKEDKSGYSQQKVLITVGTPAKVEIRCTRNCGGKVDMTKSFIMKANCTNCMGQEKYLWEIFELDPAVGQYFPARDIMESGTEGLSAVNLMIKKDTLKEGYEYILKVTVTSGELEPGFVQSSIKVNEAPYDGTCSISPIKGYATLTDFSVKCNDWKDEGDRHNRNMTIDDSSNLRYSVFSKMTDSEERHFVMESLNPDIGPFLLPRGDPHYANKLVIEVHVTDKYNSATIVALWTQVNIQSIEESIDMLMNPAKKGEVSRLDQLLGSEHIGITISTLTSLTSLVNELDTDASQEDANELKISGIYDKVSSAFKDSANLVTTFNGILQASGGLETLRPKDISDESQVNLIDTSEILVNKLEKMPSLTPESTDEAIGNILDSLGYSIGSSSNKVDKVQSTLPTPNIIASQVQEAQKDVFAVQSPKQMEKQLEATRKETLIQRDLAWEKARNNTKKSLALVETLKNISMAGKIPTEPTTEFNTGDMVVQMDQVCGDKAASTKDVGGMGNVQIPHTEMKGNFSAEEGNCPTVGIEGFDKNPYVWSESAVFVTSPVLSLDLGGNKDEVNGEKKEPVDVSLPVAAPDVDPVYITPKWNDSMVYYTVNLTANYSALQIEILPANESVGFIAYVAFGFYPSIEEYDWKYELPISTGSHTFILYGEKVIAGRYNLGLKQYVFNGSSLGDPMMPQQNFSVIVYEFGCREFNDLTEEWESGLCQLDVEAFAKQRKRKKRGTSDGKVDLSFKSRSPKPIAGGLIIPPNTIDFDAVFSNFLERFMDSPVVLCVILLVFIIYIPLVVHFRKKDKKDQLRWTVFPVSKNKPYHNCLYRIFIHTSLKRGAGTMSTVHMVFAGSEGKTSVRTLDSLKHNGFDRGSVFIYLLSTSRSLGVLEYIKIWHDNSGPGKDKDWHLSEILIEDLITKEKYTFVCNSWLSMDRGEGRVDKTILAASEEETKDGQRLFNSWMRRLMFEQHLWLSVLKRPKRSNFTRVQRLTCCLTTLYLMMVANAMWYRDDKNTTEEIFTIRLGPIILTYYQIYSSLMSSVIVVPLVALVVQIFRKTDSRRKTLKEAIDDLKAFKRRKMVNMGVQIDQEAALPSGSNTNPLVPSQSGNVSREPVWRKTAMRQFPYVSLYLAWFLCIAACLVSAFFTFMYSLYWGGEVSNQWLTAFLLSTSGDILVFSTLQVILLVLFFVTLAKSPDEEDTADMDDEVLVLAQDDHRQWQSQVTLGSDSPALSHRALSMRNKAPPTPIKKRKSETDLVFIDLMMKSICHDALVGLDKIEEADKYKRKYKDKYAPDVVDEDDSGVEIEPPSDSQLQKSKFLKRAREKVVKFMKSLFARVIYVICGVFIAYGTMDFNAHPMRGEILGLFSTADISFADNSGPKAFWAWTEEVLVPNLYADDWYNGQMATWRERRFIVDRESFRLGPPRLRSLRIVPNSCDIVGKVSDMVLECNPFYSNAKEDKRDYLSKWYKVNNMTREQLEGFDPDSPFLYHTNLGGVQIQGKTGAFYTAGGYKSELGEEREEAEEQIQVLKSNNWLDLYTRFVSAEFTLYNANVNMFIFVMMTFELLPVGGALTSAHVTPFRVYSSLGYYGGIVMLCQVIAVIILIGYTLATIYGIWKEKKQYLKNTINLVNLLQIVLSYGVVAMYASKVILTNQALKKVFAAKGTFYNFQELVLVSESYVTILGLVVFINMLLLLKIIEVSPKFRVFSMVISRGASSFRSIGLQFLIFFMAFTSFYNMHYGSYRWEYATYLRTFEALCSVFLGGGANFKVNVAIGDDFLGRFMVWLFVIIVVFTLTNMFIAVLCDLLNEVKTELLEESPDEVDPLNVMLNNAKKMVAGVKSTGTEMWQIVHEIRMRNMKHEEMKAKENQVKIKTHKKEKKRKVKKKHKVPERKQSKTVITIDLDNMESTSVCTSRGTDPIDFSNQI